MSPSGRDSEGAGNVSEVPPRGKIAPESPAVAVDDGHWEDFTCVTPWEDFVRSLEDLLRGWKAFDTELVTAEDAEEGQLVLSKCLEHDGQLFSLQLVPGARMDISKTRVTRSASVGQTAAMMLPSTPEATRGKDSTVSAACDLENRRVDFSVEVGATPLQRWFGLEQYILLRSLGPGEVEGMSLDQLLSAVTIAAGNSKCSVPLLVSCDWDGLDYDPAEEGDEEEGQEEEGHGDVAREGDRLENVWDLRDVGGDATCKGYSAPGSKGVACSVRFETAVAVKPSTSYLFLDGLSTLFVSKLRDARTSPGRLFAPTVTTSVQQSWQWKVPRRDPPMPAPSLPWGPSVARAESQSNDKLASRSGGSKFQPVGGGGEQGERGSREAAGEAVRTTGNSCRDGDPIGGDGDYCSDARKAGARRLLKAIVGDNSDMILWGPTEDPLVSINVRVRWTDLRDGLAEENSLYSTLDPMHGMRSSSFGRPQSIGGCAGQWFVSARWKGDAMTADAGAMGEFSPGEGRLSAACFHLLSALVLTTTMHPGTLMADLGAAAGPDSPQVIAEEYGKAAAASLSQEARASIERLCSRNHRQQMHHDEIDHILAQLFAPDGASERSTDQGWRTTILQPDIPQESTSHGHEEGAVFRRDSHGQETMERGQSPSHSATDWRQVFPRQGEYVEEGRCAKMRSGVGDEEALSVQGEGGPGAARSDSPGLGKACDGPRDGSTSPGHTSIAGICAKAREESLWVWTERGSVPIGRLLSLLAMRVADCDDLASMSLLWMSFVRDVRLLWEEGKVISRMSPMLALDGTSMLDPGAGCTGQDWGIAPRLRTYRQAHGDVWSKEGAASVRERARPGQPYPDTRTSLIWQKLQMLNCCLSEIADGGPTPVHEQKPFDALIGGENAKELFISIGSLPGDDYEDNEDDDDGEFFDTHEWQRSDSDSDYGDMNRIMKPVFSDYNMDDRGDDRGRPAGDSSSSSSTSAAHALSSPHPVDRSPEQATSASAISPIPAGENASSDSRSLVQSTPTPDSAGGLGEDLRRKALGESGAADPDGSEVTMPASSCPPSRSASAPSAAGSPGAVPAECKAQAVSSRSVREDRTPLRLLVGGSLVSSPELQSGGPITSDMIAQQDATGQPGAHRIREVLVSDMEAFRRENEGAVFADFVRWYRPDCWQQSVGATEGGAQDTDASSTDRVDDGAKEQIRLAWPGQGQVVWREARSVSLVTPFADPVRRAPSIGKKASPASPMTSLRGWMSCWAEAEEAAKKGTPTDQTTPLWNGVTEGEKALLYLESISPQPLLVQLLSALLGLSIFVMEEACSSAKCLPVVKEAVAEAKRKVQEAAELLTDEIDEMPGKEAATRTRSVSDCSRASSASTSPLRLALIAADEACLELKRAERCLSRTVSLQRALPGQEDLLNLLAGCVDKGAEVPVTEKSQKMFLRDLLVEQASSKAAVETGKRKGGSAPTSSGSEFPGTDESAESANEDGSMPAPKTKEYVFRCRTPAPFYYGNVGRSQLDAYPTPPSRMYAKTDGKSLRVALSICESEL